MSELELLKLALIDWEKGYEVAWRNRTHSGFCSYFLYAHGLNVYECFEGILPTLYKQRNLNGADHYKESGNTFQGNADRVTALRNAIKILEA